jgi:hypothetical protein
MMYVTLGPFTSTQLGKSTSPHIQGLRQVFSIKLEVIQMKKTAGVFKKLSFLGLI